jgi:hypothetical protein
MGMAKTENELIELCHQWGADNIGTMAHNPSAAPGIVLVNGQKPDAAANAQIHCAIWTEDPSAALERKYLAAFQTEVAEQRRQQVISDWRSGWTAG